MYQFNEILVPTLSNVRTRVISWCAYLVFPVLMQLFSTSVSYGKDFIFKFILREYKKWVVCARFTQEHIMYFGKKLKIIFMALYSTFLHFLFIYNNAFWKWVMNTDYFSLYIFLYFSLSSVLFILAANNKDTSVSNQDFSKELHYGSSLRQIKNYLPCTGT